jgi:hypothetical protein
MRPPWAQEESAQWDVDGLGAVGLSHGDSVSRRTIALYLVSSALERKFYTGNAV